MSDCMTFPGTVEEFMNSYKVVDSEGIYMSKGTELVPIFRMMQWFEHMPTAQPKTGKWIYDGDCYICNQCKSAFSWWADSQTSNYCPNCGAMMKEGEEHEA